MRPHTRLSLFHIISFLKLSASGTSVYAPHMAMPVTNTTHILYIKSKYSPNNLSAWIRLAVSETDDMTDSTSATIASVIYSKVSDASSIFFDIPAFSKADLAFSAPPLPMSALAAVTAKMNIATTTASVPIRSNTDCILSISHLKASSADMT